MGRGSGVAAATVGASVRAARTPGPFRAGHGARGAGPVDDHRCVQGRAGPAAPSSRHAGGVAARWLQPRPLLQSPACPGLRGAGGRDGGHRAEPAGLPHHRRLPQAASGGTVGSVRAGAAAVPGGRSGQAGARGRGRHQAAGQRQPAQGDELPAHGAAGGEAGRRGEVLARPGRCGGRSGGCPAWGRPRR